MLEFCSRPRMALALLLGLLFAASGSPTRAQTAVNVLTRTYNNQRTGFNANETLLTTANVNSGQFGMLFSRPVDGEVYAQPLYAAGLTINGATHNVLFVATMHDTVYAFDADSPTASTPLWKTSYTQTVDGTNAVAVPTSSIPTTDLPFACGGNYKDIALEVGILSTPVIDQTAGTMYVVARTKETGGAAGTYVQRLHAINIYTGVDRIPPVVIQASYPTSAGGTIYFDPLVQNQRGALLLDHGSVYITWASHCDGGTYHGWVMRYNAATLALQNTWCSTPDSSEGGIWQSGQGPSADAAGNIYVVVGNGDTSIKAGGTGYGTALVKLTPSSTSPRFTVADWFMPYNADALNGGDLDSSCGAPLIPGPSGKTYAIMGGKNGWAYICDTSNMGKYNPNNPGSPQNDSQIVGSFQVASAHLHGSSPIYVGPTGTWIYLWGEYSSLKAFPFNGATFSSTPSTTTTYNAPNGMPGGMMTVSSNGTTAGTGIVWANLPWNGDANQAVVTGVLRAFDATDMTKELWNSHQSVARDDFGNYAKYCPPVVTNGKVYMATFSNQVVAYGILPAPLAPSNLTATGGASAIGLNWTAGPYAASYNILRSTTTSGGTYTTIATGVTTSSYTDTGLTNGKTYYYKVSATNNLGTSGYSNIASAVPVAPIIGNGTGLTGQYFVDPGDGTHLNANTLTAARLDSTVNFNWNGAAPAYGVPGTNFSVRWTGQVMAPVTGVITFTTTGDDGIRLTVNGQQITNGWVDQGPTPYSGTIALTAGQKYSLTLEYYQGGGGDEAILSWSYAGQTDTVIPATQLFPTVYAPVAPTNLAAVGGNQSVGLTWNLGLYAASYNVKRSLTAGGPYTTIASNVTNNFYTDSGLTNGTTYYYVVSTVNTLGESANSNSASATPARNTSGTGDGLLGTYYTGDDANFTPETTTPFMTFVDPVINFNANNNGIANNPVAWDSFVPANDYTVAWTGQLLAPVTGQYVFYINTDDGGRLSLNSGSGLNALINSPNYQGPTLNTSAAVTLTAGQRYDIKMEYFQGGGGATCQLFWSYPGIGQTIIPQANLFSNHNGAMPAAPTALAAVGLNQAVQLTWAAANGASTYNVKRSSAQNGVYTLVAGGVTTTTYIDSGLTNGTTYYYKVSASNLAGESADSAFASATPQGAALLLHYTYEDGPQGLNPDIISDVSLNGNAGQMIGGDAGFTTDFEQGAYAALIGAGIHPSLPANFNFGNQFTIFTYAKMNDAYSIQTILANEASAGQSSGFALYVNDYNNQSHALVFEANDGASPNVQTKTRTAANALPIGDGKYHAVAVTVNRPLGIVNFYVDGVALTSSNTIQTDFSTQQPNTYMGLFTDGFAETSGAKFDDLQIYSGMLNPADIAALSSGGATVTGQVALEGVTDLTKISAGTPLGTFTFEFRKPGTLSDLFTATGAITPVGAGSAFGKFTLTGAPLGTYDVAIKGPKNLRVSVPNVSIGASSAVPTVTLPAGDSNNDNSVDSSDFGILIGAFGSDYNLPGTGYDPTADFNFDGMVDSTDFGLLIGEFNNSGAN